MIVRDATEGDVVAIADIYNDVIATSDAIWLDDPVPAEDQLAAFRRRSDDDVMVVAETDDGSIAGYGSFSAFRSKSGYWPTVEHTIMLHRDHRGAGVGEALMVELIARARAGGRHVMIAATDAGNGASVRFHERMGFRSVGLLPAVGRKQGRPVDLLLMQLDL